LGDWKGLCEGGWRTEKSTRLFVFRIVVIHRIEIGEKPESRITACFPAIR